MLKILLQLLIYSNILFGNSYYFSEVRYNFAIDKSVEHKGEIDFFEDGLRILYPDANKSLEYKNESLIYKESNKEVELNEMQSQQIMRYFDILILIHKGDDDLMSEMFEVNKTSTITILKPNGMIKNYISSMELLKDKKKLKYIKLFLQNSDEITINIDDEIR